MRKVMYSKVSVAPATEPLSLTDAKSHLRVDHSAEDALITLIIQSARETLEKYTNRSFITQTRVLKLDSFPADETIYLPNGPVQSISSIAYVDEDGSNQSLTDNTDYYKDLDSDIARLEAVDYWPATYDKPNAVTITYVCGYGVASAVPGALKSAMLLLIGHLYENREQVVTSNSGLSAAAVEIPFGVMNLISSYILEQPATYHAYRAIR